MKKNSLFVRLWNWFHGREKPAMTWPMIMRRLEEDKKKCGTQL